jgi:hypothetical protein
MKRLLLLVMFVAASYCAWSQTSSCAQTLRLAQSIYDQGRLHELEKIITDGLKSADCDKQTKVSLHKLLTLSYIYLEEPAKADEEMLKLLNTDNYFEINESVDPAEFVALYNTFRTTPVLRVGVKLGANASQPNVVNTITAVDYTKDSEYKYGISILFGGAVDYPINTKMTLHGDLLYLQRKFETDLKVDRGQNLDGKVLTNEFEGIETQNWISLPLSFEYRVGESKINPYVAGGVSIDYLLKAKLNGIRNRDDVASVPESSYDIISARNKINISALLAAGIKAKIGVGFFVAEVRYLYGLNNITSSENALTNQRALWDPYYTDSVFKISSLVITGSYVINIFKPKKLAVK